MDVREIFHLRILCAGPHGRLSPNPSFLKSTVARLLFVGAANLHSAMTADVSEDAPKAAAPIDPAAVQVFVKSDGADNLLERDAMLRYIPRDQLLLSIEAGGAYHSVWTEAKLAALHNEIDSAIRGAGAEPPAPLMRLKKAFSSAGGHKAQARAVGMLLFRRVGEACLASKENDAPDSKRRKTADAADADAAAPAPASAAPAPASAAPAPASDGEVALDPPIVYEFVAREGWGADVTIAVRDAPAADAAQIQQVGLGSQFVAVATHGEWIRFALDEDAAEAQTTPPKYGWVNSAHLTRVADDANGAGEAAAAPDAGDAADAVAAGGTSGAVLHEERIAALEADLATVRAEVASLRGAMTQAGVAMTLGS